MESCTPKECLTHCLITASWTSRRKTNINVSIATQSSLPLVADQKGVPGQQNEWEDWVCFVHAAVALTDGCLGSRGGPEGLAKEEEGDVHVDSRIGKLGSLIMLHTSSSRPRTWQAKYLKP